MRSRPLRTLRSREFIVQVYPRSDLPRPSVPIVGLGISKKAVVRNLVKRRIRGVVHRHQYKIGNRYGFVVRPLPPALALSKKEFEERLLELVTSTK